MLLFIDCREAFQSTSQDDHFAQVVITRSHFYLNIPILSWLILLGKCRNCSSKVSIRYLLVELITGVLFLVCWLIYALPLSGQFQVTYYLVLPGWLLISLLVSASLIDYEHQIIPDALNIVGLIAGLIFAIIFPINTL